MGAKVGPSTVAIVLVVGEVFAGRYELITPIADGGMGSVWQVRDHRDGTVKAAKLLRQSDAGSLLRFIREQSVRIDHAHVITPSSWAGDDDRVLFTMPLVRGGSVADLVGDFGALPPEWTREILDQTLQGLAAVHRAAYVHRDVKPANLLLDPTGAARPHVRVSDFGVAAPLGQPRMTRASQVIGSPGYLSPEQLQGADPDPRQDVYGAGMVGLELVTGLRPPQCLAVARTTPPAGQEALVALLLDAVDDDPGARPDGAAQFRSRLAALDLPPFVACSRDDGPYVFDHVADEPGLPDAVPEPAHTVVTHAPWPAIALLGLAALLLVAAVVVLTT
jgi:serine/threonine-protein kinase